MIKRRVIPLLAVLSICGATLVAQAFDAPAPPPPVPLELEDLNQKPQPLAIADTWTVALFLRPEQEWSKGAITDLEAVRAHLPSAARAKVRLVAVWVIAEPKERWRSLPEPWLELFDKDRAAARHQHVVAYPTTAILTPDGSTITRIPSRPHGFARQIENALRFALELPPLPEVAEIASQPWRRHVHLAERLRDKGEFAAAIDALAEAEKLGADRAAWLPVRATVALDLADLVGARGWVEELEQIAAGEPETQFIAGRFARLDGRPAEAEKLLRPLLAISPHNLNLALELGRTLEALDRAAEAAEIYRKALEGVIERSGH